MRELYEVLRTATGHVVNLLNEGTPTYRLPPEILTRILYLTVDHGSEEHPKQVIPLTHVCRYWRTLLLSYPRMWSTLCMKPGKPSIISEWLARSQNLPLTVIAEFTDTYEHPPCRYDDSATATLVDIYGLGVCPRHEAVLSLNQLLPHRSRIRDLNILFHSSDPSLGARDDDDDEEPKLLYHHFFMETLPNLQRLDFRAAPVEENIWAIHIPDLLFAGQLPRLKELKYLGVFGGLMETAKDLTSCEIGLWSGSGPTIISPEELQILFNNNNTVQSLAINGCEFFNHDRQVTTATPLTDLKFLRIHCLHDRDLQTILNCIHAPQFKNLDTVQLSPSPYAGLQVVATDRSGHTFECYQSIGGFPTFYSLRHLGIDTTTLRLCRWASLGGLDGLLALYDFFRTLDAVRVLEFDGAVATVQNVLSNLLPVTGVFPGLKVIRVAIRGDDCKRSFPLLATALRLRLEEGNPLTAIEPIFVEGEDRLGRVEWENHYEAEGIRNFLSK